MKTILFLLGISLAVFVTSCSKNASTAVPSANYLTIPDTGLYIVKTGTVTVIRPDTTFTYDASRDLITIYHNSKNSPGFWDIYCMNRTYGDFYFTAIGAPTIGNATLEYTKSYLNATKLGYYLSAYLTTNAGALTLSSYNTNGIAASGSFTLSTGKYNNITYSRIGTTTYTLSGSFDLKLNPK